jgi:hypothetical protein
MGQQQEPIEADRESLLVLQPLDSTFIGGLPCAIDAMGAVSVDRGSGGGNVGKPVGLEVGMEVGLVVGWVVGRRLGLCGESMAGQSASDCSRNSDRVVIAHLHTVASGTMSATASPCSRSATPV